MGVGGLAFGVPGLLLADATRRGFTPPMALGPFYPEVKPLDQDADLTVSSGAPGPAKGQVVLLTGRVLDLKGRPVSGARVNIWQADANGHYHHRSDTHAGEVDRNFQGFAAQITDADGRYRFRTIKPGAYPGLLAGMRTPHIHFEVEGRYDRVVTQMFFPGEALNAQDRLLNDLPPAQRDLVIATRMPNAPGAAPADLHLNWDVVMLSG